MQVARISFESCAVLLLLSMVDPLQPSNQFGRDIYLRTAEIVGGHIYVHNAQHAFHSYILAT